MFRLFSQTNLAFDAVVILIRDPLVLPHHERFTIRVRVVSPSLVPQFVAHLKVGEVARHLCILSFQPRTFDCGAQSVFAAVEQLIWLPEEWDPDDDLLRAGSLLNPVVDSVFLKFTWWEYSIFIQLNELIGLLVQKLLRICFFFLSR